MNSVQTYTRGGRLNITNKTDEKSKSPAMALPHAPNASDRALSLKKLEANRRNAKLSTGPRTKSGNSHSSKNSTKHGLLASALLISKGEGAEDAAKFDSFLSALRCDLSPVGTLEETLVEQIAVAFWRKRRVLRCEAELFARSYLPDRSRQLEEFLGLTTAVGPGPEQEANNDGLCLPLGGELDLALRYETAIHRKLSFALYELQCLQERRRNQLTPEPLRLQSSHDR